MLGKFTSTWAGIIVQLVLIPAILFALQRSGVLLKYLPDSLAVPKVIKQSETEEQDGQSGQDQPTE